jgi:hypothetical protein
MAVALKYDGVSVRMCRHITLQGRTGQDRTGQDRTIHRYIVVVVVVVLTNSKSVEVTAVIKIVTEFGSHL